MENKLPALLGFTALILAALAMLAMCLAIGFEFSVSRGLVAFACVAIASSIIMAVYAKHILR